MGKQAKIVVVGSNNIDLMTYLEDFPAQGATIYGKEFQQGFGGKGSNQAVMAALLGAEVSMVTCVGDDAYGKSWLDLYAQENIQADYVTTIPNQASGTASIWVEADGHNRIVIIPGANNDLTPTRVGEAFAQMNEIDIVLSQLENPQDAILEGFQKGKANGATTILNPAPATTLIDGLLDVTDWLVPNETEFALIAKEMYGIESENLEQAILEFSYQAHTNVVITLGEKGALYTERGSGEVHQVDTISVQAKDTTGAGDAFCGTFAYGLGSGLPTEEAIYLANVIASNSVTKNGTQKSYPRDKELEDLVNQFL